ncbi:MAG: Sir2 family NAD+-dependent deacetylase [Methyloglobulus sp.]|nr:NAD-dependent protein deacylase [Methyloglobulus sp.]
MKNHKKVVILTGAGISAESGIKTFRASDGLWEGHKVEDVASPEGFARQPRLVQQFYNERRALLNSGTVHPNAAHIALAKLEQDFLGDLLLVTQNIDDLHERAGSNNLVHMHGELNKVRCLVSNKVFNWDTDIAETSRCACCERTGTLRPHIVWFGEMPLEMDFIYESLMQCDLFISIGTSGHVYPAAGFVQVAASVGAQTVELNLEPSLVNSAFAKSIHGLAATVVPAYVDGLLSGFQ